MNQVGLPHTAVSSLNLRVFNSYPYLVVRLQPDFYHLSILPTDRTLRALGEVGRSQAQINDLQVCLALGPNSCSHRAVNGGTSSLFVENLSLLHV